MKRYFQKLQKRHAKVFAHFSAIVIGVLLVAVVAQAATNYRATNGGTTAVTEFATCKSIVNNSGFDLFIPTNTVGEWSSFYDHPPSGVAINPCVSPPSMSISPTSQYFGQMTENQVATYSFTVTNSGGAGTLSIPFTLSQWSLSNINCPIGGTMAGGSSCTINVSWTGALQCGGSNSFNPIYYYLTLTATVTNVSGNSSASSALSAGNYARPLTYAACR